MGAEFSSFDPKEGASLRKSVENVLGNRRSAEFRLRDEAVELVRGRNSVRINVRENTPAERPDGSQFYTYTGIVVGPKVVYETIGAKRRNWRGVLVELNDQSNTISNGKILQKKDRVQPVNVSSLRNYGEQVEALNIDYIHDRYGRTQTEQERERRVTEAFHTVTYKLFSQTYDTSGWDAARMSMGMHGIVMPASNPEQVALFSLPNGDELLINTQGFSGERMVTILPHNRSERDVYKLRRVDGRLGRTVFEAENKKRNNPVDIEHGEGLVLTLQALL